MEPSAPPPGEREWNHRATLPPRPARADRHPVVVPTRDRIRVSRDYGACLEWRMFAVPHVPDARHRKRPMSGQMKVDGRPRLSCSRPLVVSVGENQTSALAQQRLPRLPGCERVGSSIDHSRAHRPISRPRRHESPSQRFKLWLPTAIGKYGELLLRGSNVVARLESGNDGRKLKALQDTDRRVMQ